VRGVVILLAVLALGVLVCWGVLALLGAPP
jgi:hypothetical protein